MTPEAKLKKAITAYLEEIGAYYFSPIMMGMGRKGIPDIVGCLRGKFFAIEVKVPGKEFTVTPWQEREILMILNAGGEAFVASSVEQVKRKLSQ